MLKVRIIPILTFNGFGLVKTKQFASPRMVGNPVQAARVYNSRGVDELVFLDIFASKQKRKINLKIAKDVIKECFMPVGIGGGIDSIEDINDLLKIGADKVILKTQALQNPGFIKEAAEFFGSQCITIAVDAILAPDGQYYVYHDGTTDILISDFVQQVEKLGAGELVLNAVHKDGMMSGFDTVLVRLVESLVHIPIIAVGGAGNPDDVVRLFQESDCEAVGASSIFHFTQYTPEDIKKQLAAIHKPVRL